MHRFRHVPTNAYRDRNVLGRETLCMNWGLWEPANRDLDEAARTLVLQIVCCGLPVSWVSGDLIPGEYVLVCAEC
jgi:hypothetical protein